MKKIFLFLLAAGMAVSCGSGSTKVKDQTLSYFKELASLYEKDDISAYSSKKVEFGEFLSKLDPSDDAAVYEAYNAYRDSWTGEGRFDVYMRKVLWYETNTSETVARLVTHLYAAAEVQAHQKEDAERAHPASADLSEIRGLLDSHHPRQNRGYWDIVEPWEAELEAREEQYEARRVVTGQGVGPVHIGGSIAALPASEEGIYDYLRKSVISDEAEGDVWEETIYEAVYLGDVVFVIYAEFDDPDIIRTICVRSLNFHTPSGLDGMSRSSALFRAGAKGYYTCLDFIPMSGIICDGVIFRGASLSYSAEQRISRIGDETAMWLGPDDFSGRLDLQEIWVPAVGEIDNIGSLIDNWE